MILYFLFFIETIVSVSNKCKAGELTIPIDTKIIENNEYEGCKEFTGSLIIPNSVEKISKYAFYRCSGFNGSLTISENLKEIEDFAFGETNFESINFLSESIKCSSNAFTNVPKKITVKDNYKDDYICGIQIRKPESKSWFKKNLTLVLCIAIPVVIIIIIVIIASCMKKSPYENNNKTTNQYGINSTKTIEETQNPYSYEKPKISTTVKEKGIVNGYYDEQIPSRSWYDDDEKEISDYELTESVNSSSKNIPQIKQIDHQSIVDESSPLSIHESGSDSSLSSNSSLSSSSE